MKTVIRHDRGSLRSPTITAQGFWKGEGHVGRAGIYEYRNDDGSIRRELRPLEEIQSPAALASFEAAPVTIGHPSDEEVTAENVRRHEVGTVSGPAWADGDHVAAKVVIKDARAIKLVRAGKQELSPGYRCRIDETPGMDRRYATPGNPTGSYDVVQRGHIVNHQAIVDRARGGSTIRLRMDEAERTDGGKLTTLVEGHQHLIDLCGYDGMARTSGTTQWAVSDGADDGHEHGWIRGTDGRITIAASAGHTHEILDEESAVAAAVTARVDAEIDRSGRGPESWSMDKDEQIRSLKAQLAEAVAKLTPIETTASTNAARADAADAANLTLRGENEELRAQIAAAATEIESAAITREKVRADAAEDKLRRLDAATADLVETRVDLERKVAIVMGPEFKMRGVPERQLVATAVKRMDAQADTGPRVSDAFLMGRFESLLDLRARNARSQQNVGDIIAATNAQRTDSLDEKRTAMRNQWREPLPNSREAQSARKGA